MRSGRARLSLGLLAGVNTIAVAGDRLKQFAFVGMLGMYAPGSSVELLKLNLFMQVPMLVMSPLFGALLDRWNKSLAMVVTCAMRAAMVVWIPLVFLKAGESLYVMYAFAFILSFPDQVFAPARAAIVPDLVDESQLLGANAAMWTTGIVGTLAGVLFGGWVFDFRSWEAAWYVDALAYAVSAGLLVFLAILYRPFSREADSPAEPSARPGILSGISTLATSIRDGLFLIRGNREIAVSLIVQSGLFAIGGILSVIGVARIQAAAPVGKAFFLAIVAAAMLGGLILGSGLAAVFRRTASPQRAIAVSTIMMGVAIAGLGRTEGLIPLSIWSALLGLAVSPAFISTETLMQQKSPREFLGRVFAAREALVKAAFLLAAVVATVADAFTTKGAILVTLGLLLALLGVLLERTRWLNTERS